MKRPPKSIIAFAFVLYIFGGIGLYTAHSIGFYTHPYITRALAWVPEKLRRPYKRFDGDQFL